MLRSLYIAVFKWGVKLFRGKGLSGIFPFSFFSKWLSNKVQTYQTPESIIVFGNKMFLFPKDTSGLSVWGELYERPVVELIKKVLPSGGVFVDIGANIGFFTLLAARLAGPEGKVFAFEPSLENFNLLNKNIAVNNFNNIVVEQLAVSDRPGFVDLYLSKYNIGDHSIYNRQEAIKRLGAEGQLDPSGVYDQHAIDEARQKISVKCVTMDQYFNDFGKDIDVIKMDIQGAEGYALKGMEKILQANSGIKLLLEFWPAGLVMAGFKPEEVVAFIRKNGFEIYELDEKYDVFKFIQAENLLKKYTARNNQTANIYCYRP